MLDRIEDILRKQRLVKQDWYQDVEAWGDKVALYRRYYEGDHQTYLTREMQEMLRSGEGFTCNYCPHVVNTPADRLNVVGLDTPDEAAGEWAAAMLRATRFDALQLDVHQAALRDGDAFTLVEYDEAAGGVRVSLEEAWDNVEGFIPVYDRRRVNLVAAVKVFYDTDHRRVNIYYPDRVDKYLAVESDTGQNDTAATGVQLEFDSSAVWLPGVLPVVHFKNRAGARSDKGQSELVQAIPLQDVLNRTMVSMVMTAELSAFPIRYSIGFEAPAKVAPGSWISIAETNPDDKIAVGTMDQASPQPFISQAQFVIDQIATITSTPLPSLMGGAGESGEALKERQSGLTGKVRRAQVRFGNAWEDMMRVAVLVNNVYAVGSVPEAAWECRWSDAEPRNDEALAARAKLVREAGYEREFLRTLGYDEAKVTALEAEKLAETDAALGALGGGMPGLDMLALN